MKLASLAPRDAHEKALKARRGHGLPYRPERRLVDTEAARARVAAGFRRTEQSHVTRLKDGLALSREVAESCRSETEDFGQVRSRWFCESGFNRFATGLSDSRKQGLVLRRQQLLEPIPTAK
jgi:hypothetical protein